MKQKPLTTYYLSRAVLSALFGMLFMLLGASWQMGALAAALTLVFFLWAPRSGRYTVQSQKGLAPLQRDERAQAISEKAGRNAFVVLTILLGGILSYAQIAGLHTLPVDTMGWLLLLGIVVYFFSDFALRRKT